MGTGAAVGVVGGFAVGALIVANVVGFPEVEIGEGAVGVLGAGGVASVELMDAVAGEPLASYAIGGIAGTGPGALAGGATGYALTPSTCP